MKTRFTLVSLVAAALAPAPIAERAPEAASAAREPVVLILTRPDADGAALKRAALHPLVRKSEEVFDAREKAALAEIGGARLSDAMKLTLDSEADAEALADWIRAEKLRLFVEKRAVAFNLATDRFERSQWGLRNRGQAESVAIDDLTTVSIQGKPGEDIGVDRAPAERDGETRRIIVAVLDTGVDYGHPDLDGRLVEKAGECEAFIAMSKCEGEKSSGARETCRAKYKDVDTDGNGYPLDCSGWNTTVPPLPGAEYWGTPDAADDNGHGTHVAGVIAAQANAIGVRGVAANVRILPVKVITASPNGPARPQSAGGAGAARPAPGSAQDLQSSRGFGDLVARGLLYAIRSGAHVANLSLGWPAEVESHLMREMIGLARRQGVLVVAAAGNDATDALVRPCVYEGVVCVASHDPDGGLSNFSNFGSGVDIAAPGLNILSTWPEAIDTTTFTEAIGYEIKSGTSMAAPFVSGALARLLNAGFPPREAYARLILGARHHREPRSQAQGRATAFTLSGNADLARAFEIRPQPLFLPDGKSPIAIEWNRVARNAPFTLAIKNEWLAGEDVTVEARLPDTTDAALSRAQWSFQAWGAGERKELPMSLVIRDERVGSELSLEIRFRSKGNPEQIRRVQAEIRVPVGARPEDPRLRVMPIAGRSLAGAAIRSVTALDDRDLIEYVAVEARGASVELRLLRENGGRFEVAGEASVPASKNELLLIHRVDVDLDASSDYVFVYRTSAPAPAGGQDRPQRGFQFRYFDHALRPLQVLYKGERTAVVDFDNKRSVVAETFQWMRLGNAKAPAWVARGLTPELEKKAFDPWNPDPIDSPTYRLYYLSPEGLRSVSAPGEDALVLARLAMTSEQRRLGRIPVLLGQGLDTKIAYSAAEIEDGKIVSRSEILTDRYRNLRGLEAKEITSLDARPSHRGTAFASESYRGAQRVSLIDGERVSEAQVAALSPFDTVTAAAGVFEGSGRRAVIAQTIYDLQYHDLESGATAAASLRRFSFLPGFFFFRLFFPVVVDDSLPRARGRLPAVFVSGGLGASPGVDVIVPKFNATGELLGLVRPAKLRFQPRSGCEGVGNAVPATAENASSLMFFCGDRFIRASLEY